jgi:hypothetical protein
VQFLKDIGKLLGNALIIFIPARPMLLLAGCVEQKNPDNEAVSQQETRQNCPAAFVKNMTICVFSLKLLGYNSPLKLKKLRRHGKFLNFQRLLS